MGAGHVRGRSSSCLSGRPAKQEIDLKESVVTAIRVLLVNDEKAVAGRLEELVNGSNSHLQIVQKATGRSDALRAVSEHRPDVVLLHAAFGDEQALDLMGQLRTRTGGESSCSPICGTGNSGGVRSCRARMDSLRRRARPN